MTTDSVYNNYNYKAKDIIIIIINILWETTDQAEDVRREDLFYVV